MLNRYYVQMGVFIFAAGLECGIALMAALNGQWQPLGLMMSVKAVASCGLAGMSYWMAVH